MRDTWAQAYRESLEAAEKEAPELPGRPSLYSNDEHLVLRLLRFSGEKALVKLLKRINKAWSVIRGSHTQPMPETYYTSFRAFEVMLDTVQSGCLPLLVSENFQPAGKEKTSPAAIKNKITQTVISKYGAAAAAAPYPKFVDYISSELLRSIAAHKSQLIALRSSANYGQKKAINKLLQAYRELEEFLNCALTIIIATDEFEKAMTPKAPGAPAAPKPALANPSSMYFYPGMYASPAVVRAAAPTPSIASHAESMHKQHTDLGNDSDEE